MRVASRVVLLAKGNERSVHIGGEIEKGTDAGEGGREREKGERREGEAVEDEGKIGDT